MESRGLKCNCIRCREIGRHPEDFDKVPELIVDKYKASEGDEYFISYETENAIWGLLRLRIPSSPPSNLEGSALVRELHVFGKQVPIGKKSEKSAQHHGLGRSLMAKAEEIAKNLGMDSVNIISGVGVRKYYEKLGYTLHGAYMWKKI